LRNDYDIVSKTNMDKKEKVKEIIKRLRRVYKNPRTALEYNTAWELLVATIMSAQTTDKLVNTLTPELFKKYPTIEKMAKADPLDVQKLISKVNFSGNKAKNITVCAQIIMEKHNGQVPDNMVYLDALPGVARKTANVVLGNVFKKAEGVVVDTHVMRLSTRLGLTDKKDPVKIELDLMEIVPKEDWIDFAHMLILYGREFCPARPHVCDPCPLGDLCPDKN
jgi:endonuclease III